MAVRSNFFLVTMCVVVLVACGGEGGGSSVDFPGDETAPLNSLTDAELTDVCEAFQSKALAIVKQNKGGTCMLGAVMAAMFADMGEGFGGASGLGAEELCEMTYEQCMASDFSAGGSDGEDPCESAAANAANCEASIGDVEACYNDTLTQSKQALQAFKSLSCSNISSGPPSGTSPINADGPASCQGVESQCPMVMPQ